MPPLTSTVSLGRVANATDLCPASGSMAKEGLSRSMPSRFQLTGKALLDPGCRQAQERFLHDVGEHRG
jgi:hypothetical protein